MFCSTTWCVSWGCESVNDPQSSSNLHGNVGFEPKSWFWLSAITPHWRLIKMEFRIFHWLWACKDKQCPNGNFYGMHVIVWSAFICVVLSNGAENLVSLLHLARNFREAGRQILFAPWQGSTYNSLTLSSYIHTVVSEWLSLFSPRK